MELEDEIHLLMLRRGLDESDRIALLEEMLEKELHGSMSSE